MIDSREVVVKEADTSTRLLDTAERLFADHGFDATSLRSITQAAGVNLAAVHYHFGSKEALIRAVVGRRVTPLNAERLRRLAAVPASAPPRERLAGIVGAFVVPAYELGRRASWGPRFMRLMGRAKMDAGDLFEGVRREFFDILTERFLAALSSALPDLDPVTLRWRFTMMVGITIHALMEDSFAETSSPDVCDRVIAFVMAGLDAPLAPNTEKEREG